MGCNPKPDSGVQYPLWTIAFSLLVIALCLVWDIIRKGSLPPSEPPPVVSTPEVSNPKTHSVPATRPSRRPAPAVERVPAEKNRDEPAVALVDDTIPADDVAPVLEMQPLPSGAASGGYPLGSLAADDSTGEIAGRVVLRGKPPPEKELDVSSDPVCARRKLQPLKTRFYVVGPESGLADAVVSIKEGLPPGRFPAPTNLVDIQFTNCEVEPFMSAVGVGRGVRYRSDDKRVHRVRIEDSKTVTFNLQPVVRAGFTAPQLFVPLACLTHPWETAFVSVFDHPYFAVTDGEGRFSIPRVPAGNYVLQIAHLKATGTNVVTRSVSVVEGRSTVVDIMVEVPPPDSSLSQLESKTRRTR